MNLRVQGSDGIMSFRVCDGGKCLAVWDVGTSLRVRDGSASMLFEGCRYIPPMHFN